MKSLFSNWQMVKLPKHIERKKIGCGSIEQCLIEAGEFNIEEAQPVAGSKDQIISIDHPYLPKVYLHQGKAKRIDSDLPVAYSVDALAPQIDVSSYQSIAGQFLEPTDVLASWRGSFRLLREERGVRSGLRNAQIGAIHSVMAHWSLSDSPATVVLPTGTGKTEMMLGLSVLGEARLTLVIVPSVELKNQIGEKFKSLGILKQIEVVAGYARLPKVATLTSTLQEDSDLAELRECNVIVTTPLLLSNSRLLSQLSKSITHVYFDEAHHIKAKSWNYLKDAFKEAKIVQFTATPYRLDRQPIEGKVIYQYSLEMAQRDGCFSEVSLITVNERNPAKRDLALAHAAYGRLERDRANGFVRHCMMVRSRGKERAEELERMYREEFPAESVLLMTSDSQDKKKKIQEIKEGKYSIVICVDMLKEGFDYPEFKIAAVHDLHKSLSVALQFIGRFTRDRSDLGRAHMVVNFAESAIPKELEMLYAEGSGWDKVIAEVAQSKQEEAVEFIEFLRNCQPFKTFDEPESLISPRLVNPALSCVVYRCQGVDWSKFRSAFSKRYRFSQPYENAQERVFYFAAQVRDKVKWTKSDAIRDQVWSLFMLHFSEEQGLLYIGCSDTKFRHLDLAKAVSKGTVTAIDRNPVFRSFHNIKRLKIIHAGLLKPANRNHRYSKYSGADVTPQLQALEAGGRVRKSDFVGIGYRNGNPVGVGASQKGKVWNPARVGNPQEWVRWCNMIGGMLVDVGIDPEQIFRDSAEVTELTEFPADLTILAMDWSEEIFDKYHRITLKESSGLEVPLYLCEIVDWCWESRALRFSIIGERLTKVDLEIKLETEDGHKVEIVAGNGLMVSGWRREDQGIEEFFQDYPPSAFISDGSLVAGCQHTKFKNAAADLPADFFDVWDWGNCNLKEESAFKIREGIATFRPKSIQQRVMERKQAEGAILVFNDDGAGESADVIAVFEEEDLFKVQMIHCKFSEDVAAGHRVGDLYEVCGQTVKSVKWKWEPKTLFKHLENRLDKYLTREQRLFCGNAGTIARLRKACDFTEVRFEFWIVQPGLSSESIPDDVKRLLGAVFASVFDMTECQLRFVSS